MRLAQNIKKNAGVIQRQRSSLSYLVVSDTRLRLPAGELRGVFRFAYPTTWGMHTLSPTSQSGIRILGYPYHS